MENQTVLIALSDDEYETLRILVETDRATRRLEGRSPSPRVESLAAAIAVGVQA